MTMTDERKQFLNDVITTAVEGGIGYWSQVSDYHWGDEIETTVRVHELDDDGTPDAIGVPITPAKIEDAIKLILTKDSHGDYIHSRIRSNIFEASAENDAGDIDADLADIIVQIAMFGKLVYG
jgi:hypothetical protein